MKYILIIILILKSTFTFAQNFNDTLIYTGGDTIKCTINKVKDDKVNFDFKGHKKIIHVKNFPVNYVKKITINKFGDHQIDLEGDIDSIIFFSEYGCLAKSKRLIVQQNLFEKNNKHSKCDTLTKGQRIKIKTNENQYAVSGKIQYVSDSLILLHGFPYDVKGIEKISRGPAASLLITGLSVAAFAAGVLLSDAIVDKTGNINGSNSGKREITSGIAIPIFIAVDLILTIPIGIINLKKTKRYSINKGWKIFTQ